MAAMAAVIIAAAIGLTWLSFHVTNPERAFPGEDRRGVHVVRFQATVIFIPSAFDALARSPSAIASLESSEDVKACSHGRGLDRAWYAIIYRALQSDGKVVPMTSYCRPFETTWKTWEFRAILAMIRGNPPRHPLVDFSEATISLIPEAIANAEPSEVITELIRRWEPAESRTER
jgi:hypothetical protein